MYKVVILFVTAVLSIALIQNSQAQKPQSTPVATATFTEFIPNNKFKWGKGGLMAYADRVEIDAAFEVPPGPKYQVYLMQDAAITSNDQVDPNKFISLGRLRHFKGAQSYEVPRGIDVSKFGSIIIYCEAFQTVISPARLKLAASK